MWSPALKITHSGAVSKQRSLVLRLSQRLFLLDNPVHDTVFQGFDRGHEEVPIAVLGDPLHGLTGMPGQDLVDKSDICFTVLLPQQQVEAAIEKHQVRFRQCLYTPLVTIWTFLYQALAADQSCRAAVARLLAFLCLGGDSSRSPTIECFR